MSYKQFEQDDAQEGKDDDVLEPGAVLSMSVATNDLNKWLDYREVSHRIRKESEGHIGILIDGLVSGKLIINDDMTIRQKLKDPITSDENVVLLSELVYQPRVKIKSIVFSTKVNDAKVYILNYTAALTKQPASVLHNLESSDYKIAQAIVSFFI